MLKVDDIHVRYGSTYALRGTTLEVSRGELVGLVGHNGVGKSTTLKAIARLLRLGGGAITWNGVTAGSGPAIRDGIGYVPEDRRIFRGLSVIENIQIGATIRRDQEAVNSDVDRELDRFPILRERRHQRAEELSGGQQQMLAIARALVARPQLLLLDEPTLGLAPIVVADLFDTIVGLRAEGVTILLVEQNVAKTLEVADRVYVMTPGGQIDREGTGQQLAADGEFRADYLRLGGTSRAEGSS